MPRRTRASAPPAPRPNGPVTVRRVAPSKPAPPDAVTATVDAVAPAPEVPSKVIRAWAIAQGHMKETARGRVPGVIVEQYRAAHEEKAKEPAEPAGLALVPDASAEPAPATTAKSAILLRDVDRSALEVASQMAGGDTRLLKPLDRRTVLVLNSPA